MTSVKDIALASGVSIATVSYVLNNKSGEVSPATRERVMKAVRELGYRPTPHRAKTPTQRNTVGVLLNRLRTRGLRQHSFFLDILDGVISASSRFDYATTIFTFDQWKDVPTSLRTLVDGRCDGLLFVGPPTENEIVPALIERGVPVVLLFGKSVLPNVNSIASDDVPGVQEAMRYLVSLGHSRIAHLPGGIEFDSSVRRLEGYMKGLADAGIEFDPEIVVSGGYWRESGYERTKHLLTIPASKRPTAILCGNDIIAFGALDALKTSGISVPNDMSVIGVDDIQPASLSDPPLTTIRQPLGEIGERATEILHGLIHNRLDLPTEELLPMSMVIRGSTALCGKRG